MAQVAQMGELNRNQQRLVQKTDEPGTDIIPNTIYCDRSALGALKDAIAGRWPIVPRVARWSEATEDISRFRKLVADGPLSVAEGCRALGRVGLSQAVVHSDDQGSVSLTK